MGGRGPSRRARANGYRRWISTRSRLPGFANRLPEAKRSLSYDALQLSPFEPGSLIQTERGQVKLVDPWRKPTAAFATMFNHVGSLGDRLRLARMRVACFREGFGLGDQDCSTDEWLLQRMGFTTISSIDFCDRGSAACFSMSRWRPQRGSSSSSFAHRPAAMFPYPRGMGAISEQLANRLPAGTIRYQMRVQSIAGNHLVSTTGDNASADAIVLAVDSVQRQRLLRRHQTYSYNTVGTACFYFAALSPPPVGRFLVLNGELNSATGSPLGPFSNLCVPSHVSSGYAPRASR